MSQSLIIVLDDHFPPSLRIATRPHPPNDRSIPPLEGVVWGLDEVTGSRDIDIVPRMQNRSIAEVEAEASWAQPHLHEKREFSCSKVALNIQGL